MKRFFKVLSIVTSLTIVFTGIFSCYTVSAAIGIEGPSTNLNWFDWSIEALKEVGLIFNPDVLHPTPLEMAEAINQNDSNANVQANDNSINEYINNNTTYNNQNNSKTYNNNSKFVLNYLSNYYINQCGYMYVYSYDIMQSATNFNSDGLYNAAKNWCETYGSDYASFISGYKDINTYMYRADLGEIGFVLNRTQNGYVQCRAYKRSNWNEWGAGGTRPMWHYENGSFVSAGNNYTSSSLTFNLTETGVMPDTECCISYGGVYVYKIYKTLNDLKAEQLGVSGYYINNTVYNNYKNTSGDYTVNTDNSNHATYSDVQTYIDDHHTETGNYPTPTQIEVYIENVPAPTPEPTPTPTPTPDNPSGGGSGSSSTVSGGNASATATSQGGQGGSASANNEGINITINNNHNINLGGGSGLSGNTVSGNGSGSSGGIGGIFDFLSQIGDFLGSLIKNIGNVLADIVTGIGSVVSSLLEVIPTVFNDFLGGVLGWLPPELRALVTLSISAMIIVGLIKLFRG